MIVAVRKNNARSSATDVTPLVTGMLELSNETRRVSPNTCPRTPS